MKNAIDILSMIDTPEQKRKRLFNQTCVLMQQLQRGQNKGRNSRGAAKNQFAN